MSAKTLLFVSSAFVVVVGVAAISLLGAIAKVPAGEYWTVVLGAAGMGIAWLALITVLHFSAEREHRHGLLEE